MKNARIVKMRDKAASKVYDLLKPYLDDLQNSVSDLSDHVDELEDEFRHEVHGIQSDVEYLPNEDAVNDLIRNYVDYNLSDAISTELSNIISNEGIDIDEIKNVKDALDSLVSELQEIGQDFSRVG